MTARGDVFISVTELAQRLDAGDPTTILDVRWQLGAPDGRDAYEAGHLPGAVYVGLEDELSDHGVPDRGRHPLPSGTHLQEAARGWSRILRATEAPREGGAAYRVGVWGARDRALKPQLPRTPGQVAPAPLPRSLCRPWGKPGTLSLRTQFCK